MAEANEEHPAKEECISVTDLSQISIGIIITPHNTVLYGAINICCQATNLPRDDHRSQSSVSLESQISDIFQAPEVGHHSMTLTYSVQNTKSSFSNR
jgi:hypothetical protein